MTTLPLLPAKQTALPSSKACESCVERRKASWREMLMFSTTPAALGLHALLPRSALLTHGQVAMNVSGLRWLPLRDCLKNKKGGCLVWS